MADEPKKKVTYGVLPRKLGGGPHGLGDPDDKSLRKVEKDVLILQKLRAKTREEKCVSEVKEYSECCKEAGFMMTFNCRAEVNALKACATKWFYDKQFIEECTQEYLNERTEYRRTGITKKQRALQNLLKSNI